MRVLAVTHGPSVGAGVFAEAIEAGGHTLSEWCVPVSAVPPPGAADAVIVLGGGMHADQEELHPWLLPELGFLRETLEAGTPLLGICLGAQLIARAAGTSVFRASEPEVGWLDVELSPEGADDPVLGTLPERFAAFQWHHYTYEPPAGSVELARSPVCTQAFRRDAVWGVQFHPEVTAAQIERWMTEDPDDVADEGALREETRERIGTWNRAGRALCTAFLDAAAAA